MLQFLPLIMSLLESKKKDEQASNQNSAAAMLGQAPTAQAPSSGDGAMGALGGMLQKKSPDSGLDDFSAKYPAPEGMSYIPNNTVEPVRANVGHISKGTNKLLDEGLGKMSDDDEDDKNLLSM